MKDFMDRQPTQVGRRRITYANGREEYVTVEMADEPTREATPLNRESFMAVQGFQDTETTFNPDGTIDEATAEGGNTKTIFNPDGTITTVFANAEGVKIAKKTTFNADGTISTKLIDVEGL